MPLTEQKDKEVRALALEAFRRYISWEDDPMPKTIEQVEEMVCDVTAMVVGALEKSSG